MDFLKLSSLPKLLPPRKGRLANLKRSQEVLTPAEQQLAEGQFVKMYQDKDQTIDKQDLKILYVSVHVFATQKIRLLRLNLKMSELLLNEYVALQISWGEKSSITFEDFMGFYQEILANQTPVLFSVLAA